MAPEIDDVMAKPPTIQRVIGMLFGVGGKSTTAGGGDEVVVVVLDRFRRREERGKTFPIIRWRRHRIENIFMLI